MKNSCKIIISILYLLFGYIAFFLCIKRFYFINFSYDLLLFFTIFNIFILCHLFIDLKKMYDFIYQKRYIIGLIVLSFLVIGKYNGSSIELWNDIIQPEYKLNNTVIFGIPRGIRSDEWLVSTPLNLTQETMLVNNSSNNEILGAHSNLVTLYPNLPSKDISILSTPNNIGYLFLDSERAFSLSWYLPYFILFFSTFEMFMILTKKHKLYSLVGAILISLSPVIGWWQSANIPAYGALAIVLFYYFIIADKWSKKLFLSMIFGYTGFLYIMCMYPAWQVPYAYVYLILLIWIIAINSKKIYKSDFLYLIPILLVIIIPMIIIFKQNNYVLSVMNSTVYPGERMSTGGGEWRTLFTYVLDIFYPYKRHLSNPCELAQYLSLYPIPIIYSIYLMIKNKKKDLFLILSNIVLICLSIWIFFPLPKIISKLTLIYMSTENRAQVAVGYLSIIEIIYILNYYENVTKNNFFNLKKIIISLIITIITIKISNNIINIYYPGYVNLLTSLICLIIYGIVIYLFISNNKKTNTLLCIIFVFISVVSSILISPINKGLSIFYNKPISKKINELVKDNSDSIFMSVDGSITTANYLAVNGARTINTTNYIPNLDLYHKLDPELKYNDVYNRYEHIAIKLIDEETTFYLVQADCIRIELNKADICKIGADYLAYNGTDISNLNEYQEIYDGYNFHLFKTNCNTRDS